MITIRIVNYYSLLTHLFEDLINRPMAQMEPQGEMLKQKVETLSYHYLSLPIGQWSLFDWSAFREMKQEGLTVYWLLLLIAQVRSRIWTMKAPCYFYVFSNIHLPSFFIISTKNKRIIIEII